MVQLLTVFGATGKQGGSVVETILAHPALSSQYKIRAVTRDPSKPAAEALKKKGVEVVAADLNVKASVHTAVEGSQVVFGVTDCMRFSLFACPEPSTLTSTPQSGVSSPKKAN